MNVIPDENYERKGKCCVPNCSALNTERFHRFPPNRISEWCRAIRDHNPSYVYKKSHRVCDKHFSDKNYGSTLHIKLSKFAVPDVFDNTYDNCDVDNNRCPSVEREVIISSECASVLSPLTAEIFQYSGNSEDGMEGHNSCLPVEREVIISSECTTVLSSSSAPDTSHHSGISENRRENPLTPVPEHKLTSTNELLVTVTNQNENFKTNNSVYDKFVQTNHALVAADCGNLSVTENLVTASCLKESSLVADSKCDKCTQTFDQNLLHLLSNNQVLLVSALPKCAGIFVNKQLLIPTSPKEIADKADNPLNARYIQLSNPLVVSESNVSSDNENILSTTCPKERGVPNSTSDKYKNTSNASEMPKNIGTSLNEDSLSVTNSKEIVDKATGIKGKRKKFVKESCCVPNCNISNVSHPEVRLIKFPLNRTSEWISTIKNHFCTYIHRPSHKICQLHFSDRNFNNTLHDRLSTFACPDIFDNT